MKISAAILLTAAGSAAAFAPPVAMTTKTVMPLAVSKADILSSPNTLEFGKVWDPLGLAELGSDETLAFFRHSEVKHGRIAMAAFVGWWAVAAGLRFPGELSFGQEFASLPAKGLDAWDAVPGWGKAQLLLFAGLIEFHDELFYSTRGDKMHYLRGGIPGKVRNGIL
jgi:Chlorophyll A-B binding protein